MVKEHTSLLRLAKSMLEDSTMVSSLMESGFTKTGPTSKVTSDQTNLRAKDSGHLQTATKSLASILRPSAQILMVSNFRGELQVIFLTEPMLKIRFASNSNTLLSNVCMHHLFSTFFK